MGRIRKKDTPTLPGMAGITPTKKRRTAADVTDPMMTHPSERTNLGDQVDRQNPPTATVVNKARRDQTFDVDEGREGRDQGVQRAASSWTRRDLVAKVRAAMVDLAKTRDDRTVTIDDATAWCVRQGLSEHALGRAAGGVFRKDTWTRIGYTPTTRKTSHARPVAVWKLKD